MRECRKCDLCFPDDISFCPEDGAETRLTLPGGPLIADRYELKKRLGSGAMGQVYLAIDQKLGTRKVAVKTVRQELLSSSDLQEGEAIARFEREAKAAASINHPNVVAVTDYGETQDGLFYLVMEYVEGETLHKLLRREGTLTIKRALNLLKQIAEGVEAAHSRGILHRDLKPGNIFLLKSQDGVGDGYVKIGDFGLAKIISEERSGIELDSGPKSRGIVGTPEFMAPEQIDTSQGPIDVRADIYAIGTIAYLMLGGKTPFSGNLTTILVQKASLDPPSLSSIRSDIPPDVEQVIMWALRRDVSQRPKSVREWIEALEKVAGEIDEQANRGKTRLVILAPQGSEVYVDDERKGMVGSSGRLIINNLPIGQHILRISKAGEKDDERLIEIRGDTAEQVIQAQFKSSGLTSAASGSGAKSSILPGIVACKNCGARFAEGVKFCGKCGKSEFTVVSEAQQNSGQINCPRCASLLPSNAKFCGRCGAPIISKTQSPSVDAGSKGVVSRPNSEIKKLCVSCGMINPLSAKFCGRCGAIV